MQQQQKAQFAQRFSQLSDLTPKQQESLSRLSRLLDEDQLPPHLQHSNDNSSSSSSSTSSSNDDDDDIIETPTIDTMSQFYKWFNTLESSARTSISHLDQPPTDSTSSTVSSSSAAALLSAEYPRLHDPAAGTAFGESRALQGYARDVQRVQDLASEWTRLVHETTAHCVHVRERASSIHERACAMSATQADSESLASALEERIKYFDQLYPLTRRLYAPNLTALINGSDALSSILSDLDECSDFMQAHPSYKESETYLTKYKQLQTRALTTLKSHIIDSLRATTTSIEQQQQLLNSQALSAQRMRSAPSSSSQQQVLAQHQLSLQAQKRSSKLPRLLPDAVDSAPLALQFRILAARLRPHCAELEKRAVGRELGALLGDCHSCYFHQRKMLLQGRVQETLGWMVATGGGNDSGDGADGQIGENALGEIVRKTEGFVVQVCRLEVGLFGMFFQSKTPLIGKLVESLAQSLEFVLRPLVIREKSMDALCSAAAALRDDAVAEKLDVPELKPLGRTLAALAKDAQERITYLAQREIRDEIAFFNPSEEDIDYPDKLIHLRSIPLNNASGDDQADLLETVQRMYATWYPSLQRTLMLLSKIYLTVDMNVFEGLASEAIEQCLNNLLNAKDLLNERKGATDAQLFLIQHLLALKEQVAPFEASFTETQVTLDFTTMRSELRRILSGGIAQLFTPSAFAPQVSTSTVDSLQRVGRALAATVEAFVVAATRALVGDLASFLVRVTSFEKVNEGGGKLKEQSWASIECFKKIGKDTILLISEKIPRMVCEVEVYLQSRNQVEMVFGPIRDAVLDSWEQFLLVVNRTYPENSTEFMPLAELQKIMDDHVEK